MNEFHDLIERFDHVGMGVPDIASTLPFVELLGGRFIQGGDNLRNRFRWVQFRLPGGGKLELLQPLEGNDFLTRFLERRGSGVHHLTFKVRDLKAVTQRAEQLGLTTTGYHESREWSEVFLHPATAHGVVVQFAMWEQEDAWRGPSLEEVLAGRSLDHS